MKSNRTVLFAVLFLALTGVALLTGCVTLRDPESSFDTTSDVVATIAPGTPISQSAISRRAGMNGVQIWLRKGSSQALDSDILTVTLLHLTAESTPLASVAVTYGQISHSFPIQIQFPIQNDPPNQAYLIRLETQGGPLALYGRNEDAYPDGALYAGDRQLPADMAFRLSYEYGIRAVGDDLIRWLSGAWLALPLILLLLVPGLLALWTIGGDPAENGWDWGQIGGLAVGLSLGITPLALLWTSVMGLRWGRLEVWLGFGLAALALGWTVYRRTRRGWRFPKPDLIDLGLAGIFLLALGLRLAIIRDLAAPAWVDPVHHSMIVRLIVEQGAYPESYAAYVEAGTASYHPGYHALTAALHWLSSLELDQTMLIFGQVLNALIVPTMYLLTTALTHNRKSGLFAALIAGFLTPMPAYYTSWGRYTQLAGILIIPAAAALLLRLLEQKVFWAVDRNPETIDPKTETDPPSFSAGLRLAGLSGLAGAGLFMVHYRAAAFWALLMVAFFTAELIRSLDKKPLWKTIPQALGWVMAAGLLAVLISLPWWPDLVRTLLLPGLDGSAPPPQALTIDWGYLTPAYGREAMWLAAAGLVIATGGAKFFGPALVLWVGLLLLSANQGMVRIPGAGQINLSSVEIMLFMPIAVSGGYALAVAAGFLQKAARKLHPIRGDQALNVLIGVGMLAAMIAGSQKLLPILNPTTLLFREADREAIEWIQENVPEGAAILINPFLWGYGYYAGQDGGYWITPMAGRATIPPNLLYAMGSQASIERVKRISQQTLELAGDPAGLKAMMEPEGICYAYLGRRGGALSGQKLAESGLFETLFHKNGVWVFQAQSPECKNP